LDEEELEEEEVADSCRQLLQLSVGDEGRGNGIKIYLC
jgi:hypothetical protein